jgi:hypothetical protein
MVPRIYVYKITFVDRPEWYWGVHKEKKYGEYYMGSPETHKDFWLTYEPVKEILEVFDYSEEGWAKALEVEAELIRPDLNNPLCLNENCGIKLSLEVISLSLKKRWQNEDFRKKHSERLRRLQPEAIVKALTPEARERKKESLRRIGHQKGEKNNMYGMMWITNGTPEGTFRIPVGSEVPDGYFRGRTYSSDSKVKAKKVSAQTMIRKAEEFGIDLKRKGWMKKLSKVLKTSRGTVARVIREYLDNNPNIEVYLYPPRR